MLIVGSWLNWSLPCCYAGPAPPPTRPLQLRLLSCQLQIVLLIICNAWAVVLTVFCSVWAFAAAWVCSAAQGTIRYAAGCHADTVMQPTYGTVSNADYQELCHEQQL
jgi:hypothetical protein